MLLVLDCTCCGGITYALKQWWNQDKGYGICKPCFDFHVEKYGLEFSENCFGKESIHHSVDEFLNKKQAEELLAEFAEAVKPAWQN